MARRFRPITMSDPTWKYHSSVVGVSSSTHRLTNILSCSLFPAYIYSKHATVADVPPCALAVVLPAKPGAPWPLKLRLETIEELNNLAVLVTKRSYPQGGGIWTRSL